MLSQSPLLGSHVGEVLHEDMQLTDGGSLVFLKRREGGGIMEEEWGRKKKWTWKEVERRKQ